MSTELLSTRAAAEALAISESSVRRWCDEGKLTVVRTAGGHRKIPLTAVMKLLRETGQKVDESTVIGNCSVKSKRPLHESASHLISSLCEGHEQSSVATIASAFSAGYSISEIGDQLVGPAMIEVGRRWEANEINVAVERRACHLAMHGLFEIERLLPIAEDTSPLAVGATPGQDYSQVGTKLVELLLRSIGWRTQQLGAGIPLADIAATCQAAKPDLFWLSVVHLENAASFVADYRTHIEPLLRQMTRITVGGRAMDLEIRRQLQFSFYGDSLTDLQTYVAGLSGSAAAMPLGNSVNLQTGNISNLQSY